MFQPPRVTTARAHLAAMIATLLTSTTAMGFGVFGNDGLSKGARWDAAPRLWNYELGTVWERSLDGGIRYSLQGGSYEAYRDSFTWFGAPPSVSDFQQMIEQSFNYWTTPYPFTGLGSDLQFVYDPSTPVVQGAFVAPMFGPDARGAEIDLFARQLPPGYDGVVIPSYLNGPVDLTSGRTDYDASYFIGNDLWMTTDTVWDLSSFARILTHEIGHAIGLDDVETSGTASNFIDDNYNPANDVTAQATLTNAWDLTIDPVNPANSPAAKYFVADVKPGDPHRPGFDSPGADILMESNNPAFILSADDYAGRQFLYPKLHFTNPVVIDGFGFEPKGDGATFIYNGSLTLKNNANMNIPGLGFIVASGDLLISSGSDASNKAAIVNGTATVQDPGTTWTNSGTLIVGFGAAASLNVSNDAAITSTGGQIGVPAGSNGVVNVFDASWTTTDPAAGLSIGNIGTGSVQLFSASSNVNIAGTTTIGPTGNLVLNSGTFTTNSLNNAAAGSIFHLGGTLNIKNGTYTPAPGPYILDGPTGANLTLDNATLNLGPNFLFIGNTQQARLDLKNGATLSNNGASISWETGSSAIAAIDNATWNNAAYLEVGRTGHGLMQITNGGAVTNTSAAIGVLPTADFSTVAVLSGSTWTNTGNLIVAQGADAILAIEGASTVTTPNAWVGFGPGTHGTANIGNAT